MKSPDFPHEIPWGSNKLLVHLPKNHGETSPSNRAADPGHAQFGAIGQAGWPAQAVGVGDSILVLEHDYCGAVLQGRMKWI